MQNFKLADRTQIKDQADHVFGYQTIAAKLSEVYSTKFH
jgi:hypothetical protein